ncbi:MAG: chorismate mutase [Treponema sp.]|nr:chorismate mutase [Treponema sp.]
MKRLYGFRGATGTENTTESIIENTCAMCRTLFAENAIQSDDIVSIQFTLSPDVTACNPAAALRKGNAGIDVSRCALFTALEPVVENSLPYMIRVLVTAYAEEGHVVQPVYRNGAERLRPDFVKK